MRNRSAILSCGGTLSQDAPRGSVSADVLARLLATGANLPTQLSSGRCASERFRVQLEGFGEDYLVRDLHRPFDVPHSRYLFPVS